jgi:ubiquinone/menaquinone biosynthesis C-methylase UbiE
LNWLGAIIQNHVDKTDIVLDIGCGIMQATTDVIEKHSKLSFKERLLGKKQIPPNLDCKMIVGIDIWKKYLEKNKHRYIVLNQDVKSTDIFLDRSFDVVMSLDVVEHLEEKDARMLINEMERIARKKVIIYTPKEFQTNEKNEENAWDMGENPYQIHQSCLTPEFFKRRGYFVSFPEPDRNTLAIKNLTQGYD